jgi:NADH-quinone oxidoreductase subunit F
MSKNLRGLSARQPFDPGLHEETLAAAVSGEERPFAKLAARFLTGEASLLGASSCYDFTRQWQDGKRVHACDGTACLVSGRQPELRTRLEGHFGPAEIGRATCLGQCHRNDAFLRDGATGFLADLAHPGSPASETSHPRLSRGLPPVQTIKADQADQPTQADQIDQPSQPSQRVSTGPAQSPVPSVPTGTNVTPPILLAPLPPPEDYYTTLLDHLRDPAQALIEITHSGLRGRGGAGYPFHLKLMAARDAHGERKYVVCNADEGDPGAFSDKWLLEERPHAVLAGMLAVARIIGAEEGVLYIRAEYPEAIRAIQAAIARFEALTLAVAGGGSNGGNASGAAPPLRFHVVAGAGAYVCGEETALLNSIEGLRPEVRTRPPYPTHYGLFGQPTLLSNVETLANLPAILTAGGRTYAARGTTDCTGTKLVSLDGGFRRPGVYEIEMGTPLREILNDLGGGTRYPVKAYQIGGPLGGLVPASKVADLTLDFASFGHHGFLLGHAGIVAIPARFPLADLLAHLFAFAARESCGKCFPCRIGTRRGQELLAGALHQGRKIDPALFADLLATLEDGSLCALGGGLPLPVRNALTYFGDELAPLFAPSNQDAATPKDLSAADLVAKSWPVE